MSFLSEKKAGELFTKYKQAELSGEDDLAQSLEKQLTQAGWKITNGQDGWMIVKQKQGLFSSLNNSNAESNFLIPKRIQTSPYYGDSNSNKKAGVYILIGIGAIVLIIAIVLAIKAYKKGQNGRVEKIQERA